MSPLRNVSILSQYAYIDPGAGSSFFQVIIAVLVLGLFFIKSFFNTVKGFFIKLFFKNK